MTIEASAQTRIALRIGFAAWLALLVLQILWHGIVAAPTGVLSWPALALAVVPLALPLLALRQPSRALLLAGMVALFYFAHGIADAWSGPAVRGWAIAEIVLSVLLVLAYGASSLRRKR